MLETVKRKIDITLKLIGAEKAAEDAKEATCIIGAHKQSQIHGSESDSGQWSEDQGQGNSILNDDDVGIEDCYHTKVVVIENSFI